MAERVRVMVRLRPPNDQEQQRGDVGVAHVEGPSVVVGGDRERHHTFDYAFGHDATQDELFDAIGNNTVSNVIKGFNGTVLAYGQTGSGKTHTMLGPAGGQPAVLDPNGPHYAHRGLIPRLAETLFERLLKFDTNEISWVVTVSVFELYKELIYDSLTDTPLDPSEYRIREDAAGGRGIYVDKLYAKRCTSASEVLEAIRVGAQRRKVAATGSNETSSRSHSVTLLSVTQTNHLMGSTVTSSRLTLVDLAGSEKVGKTGAGGDRLKEAQSINLSLTLLGNVIFKLTDGKSAYIPYRDSKLTRLLQDSLGGNSLTTLLCCASPAAYNKEETISTLAFAVRAKQITNKPRVNRDLSSGELKAALAKALDEIADLKERFAMQAEFWQRHQSQQHLLGSSPSKTGLSPQRRSLAGAAADDEDGGGSQLEQDDVARLVERLMEEVRDLKEQLREKADALETAEKQVEFHRRRAAEADETIAALNARLKREEGLFERRLAELQHSSAAPAPAMGASSDSLAGVSLVDVGAGGGAGVTAPPTPPADDALMAAGAPFARNVGGAGTASSAAGRRPSKGPSGPTSKLAMAPSDIGNAPRPDGRRVELLEPTAVGLLQPGTGGGGVAPLQVAGSAPEAQSTGAAKAPGPSLQRGGSSSSLRRPLSGDKGGRLGPSGRPVATSGGARAVGPPAARAELAIVGPGQAQQQQQQQLAAGASSTELELRLERLEAALRKAKAEGAAAAERATVAERKRVAAEDACEALRDKTDAQQRMIDDLRRQLEASLARQNDMKRILDALNIDIEEQLELERRRANDATSEASRLRSRHDELVEAQAQQEFLDLASAELLFKTEDLEAVENDIVALRFSRVDDETKAATSASCRETLRQLDEFLNTVLARISHRTFATANLETMRLNVISEALELQGRGAVATNRISSSA